MTLMHSSIRGLLQATALKNAINTPYSYAECNNSKRIVERRRILILVIALALSCVLLGGICIGYILTEYVTEESPEQLSSSAAVTAISKMCAHIGRDVLRENGSAVDAAIAMLFCETVSTPQSMGLGGGFVGVIYDRASGQAHSINARETAPAVAHRDMFNNMTRVEGIHAFAVPGELRGYGELHSRYGRLPWRRLIQPSIDMARHGFPVTTFLSTMLQTYLAELVPETPAFRELFWNELEDRLVRPGELVRRVRYADTLELIAIEGVATMYETNGTLAQQLIQDVRQMGGLVTLEDLRDYRVHWLQPDTARIYSNVTLYTTPLPTSGSVLVFIMHMLDGFLPKSLSSVTFYHRLMEAFKFAYAKRADLGDPKFEKDVVQLAKNLNDPVFARQYRAKIDDERTFNETQHYGLRFERTEDHGTVHISVLAPDGDAVAITSTLNLPFGCKIISSRTGIFLNDEMDDFSVPGKSNFFGLPASPANFIAPGKTPISSLCPSILVNADGDVEMVIGAAGGSKVTTLVATMIIRHLDRNQTILDAMNEPRMHHQLLPMHIMYETGFDDGVLEGLRTLGHGMVEVKSNLSLGGVYALTRVGKHIEAVSESRRNGSVALL